MTYPNEAERNEGRIVGRSEVAAFLIFDLSASDHPCYRYDPDETGRLAEIDSEMTYPSNTM